MVFNPAKGLSANSAEEFLSESQTSIMRLKNLTCIEWMEGMEDEGFS